MEEVNSRNNLEKLDINRYVPFGATLEILLNHPSLTPAKLKRVLRNRGVFVRDFGKSEVYPILISTILSPLEFNYLKELVRSKESNTKIQTVKFPYQSDKDLIDIVPEINLKEILLQSRSRDKIVKQSNFAFIDNDRNKLKMTFTCQTTNYNSGWYRTKNEYPGEILVEKSDNKLIFKIIHTSEETLSIGKIAVKELERKCKSERIIQPDASEEKITYSSFIDNSERVKFILSLTEGDRVFEFSRIEDFDLSPDLNKPDYPNKLSELLSGAVKKIKLSGDSLHDNFLIKEPQYHPYIEISGIEITYKYSYSGASGRCKVRCEFVNYMKKKNSNSEFSISIEDLVLDSDYSHVNKHNVTMFLLQEYEKFKTIKFDWIKYNNKHLEYTPTN